MTSYKVEMYDESTEQWWPYGTYTDHNKANEIAMWVRDTRQMWVRVVKVEG